MKKAFFAALTLCLVFATTGEAQNKADAPKKISKPLRQKSAKKSFYLGTELRSYTYSEPGFVSHTGYLYGLAGEWNWSSALGPGKTSSHLLFGALVYDGQSCNLSGTVCNPLTATTNDIIGKISTRLEYAFNTSFSVFYGGGFRYLNDKGEGASFYTRTGEWIYLPVGAVFSIETSAGVMYFEFEYAYVISGVVRSALSEVSSSLTDITSNQKGGYGIAITAGVDLTENYTGALVYEYWYANDSDLMFSGGQGFREPANTSQALGLKLGYLF